MPCSKYLWFFIMRREITNRNRRWNCDKDNFTVCFQLLSHHMINHCASSWTPHQPLCLPPPPSIVIIIAIIAPNIFTISKRVPPIKFIPLSTIDMTHLHSCNQRIHPRTVRTNVVFFVMQLAVQINIFQGMCHSCHPPIALTFGFVCSSFCRFYYIIARCG